MEINNTLKALAQIRKEIQVNKELSNQVTKELEATPEYIHFQQLANARKIMKEGEDALYEEVTAYFLMLSKETNYETKKFGKVTVKEFTKVNILDKKLAITWATQNYPSCITLSKDFDAAVKILDLPFIKVEKEYKAQVATDLSDLLVEDENESKGL